jgi:hypothetical protein
MVAIEHSGRTFCAVITRPTTIPNPMRKGRIAALLPLPFCKNYIGLGEPQNSEQIYFEGIANPVS